MTKGPASKIVHPLEQLAGYQLRRASAAMQADLGARLAALGLTVLEMSATLVIEANPGLTQSAAGRLLGIKSANMAPIAAALLRRGLISREAADGRSQRLLLTVAGRALVPQLRARIEENDRRFVAGLVPEDRARLGRILHSIWSA